MQPLEKDVETLRHIPLFTGLPPARLKLIAYTAEIVRFTAGEVLMQQGDQADAVYIIIEGEAEVLIEDDDGHQIHVTNLGANSLLGEIAVIARSRRTTTVRARGPVTSFKIAAKVFLDLLRTSPEIGMQVMMVLAQRLERTTALLHQHDHSK
jgi:CRP-like cAMP-binding protein